MWFISGEDISLRILFKAQDARVIPDDAKCRVTIRNGTGVAFPSFNDLEMDAPGTFLDLTIPGLINTPGVTGEQENRFLTVKWRFDGKPMVFQLSYRLSPFLPILASAETVRKLTGLSEIELPDEDVDLYQAYYDLLVNVPSLETLLQATDIMAMKANDAIALQAAILIAPSIPQRILASVKGADAQHSRLSSIKPGQLDRDLRDMLKDLISSMMGADETTVLSPTKFLVGSRTDPVTGA